MPLIPRYFDLLRLFLETRGRAVTRREILETVWSDVVVTDGALSQAVRSLRRVLDDDPRSPRFLRTLSRHGYLFIFEEVVELTGLEPTPAAVHAQRADTPPGAPGADPRESALAVLLAAEPTAGKNSDDDADRGRDAAERLHMLGTAEALRLLDDRPGRERALAYLRDTRWDVPGSGPVPLLGAPGGLAALRLLAGMRLRLAARHAATRVAGAAAGGAAAGAIAGLAGGLVLLAAPGPKPPATVPVALALIAACVGGIGAWGVGAGLTLAEVVSRSWRGTSLVLCGGLGGGLVGALSHLAGRWTLEGLFGHDLSPVGGGYEGMLLGAAAGFGYALATPRPAGGGLATPRGRARVAAALSTGALCTAAAILIAASGGNLGGTSLDFMARSFQGSHIGITPVAHLLGEEAVGPRTRAVLGAYEGLMFGAGLAWGMTRRPKRA